MTQISRVERAIGWIGFVVVVAVIGMVGTLALAEAFVGERPVSFAATLAAVATAAATVLLAIIAKGQYSFYTERNDAKRHAVRSLGYFALVACYRDIYWMRRFATIIETSGEGFPFLGDIAEKTDLRKLQAATADSDFLCESERMALTKAEYAVSNLIRACLIYREREVYPSLKNLRQVIDDAYGPTGRALDRLGTNGFLSRADLDQDLDDLAKEALASTNPLQARLDEQGQAHFGSDPAALATRQETGAADHSR